MRHHDGLVGTVLGLGLAQAVAVALAVAELQRVERHLRQLDRLELAVVKQQLQAPPRGDAHVEAAVRADPQAVLQLAVENHLAAARALFPEVVRHLQLLYRPEERREGKGCVSTCRSWWSPDF